MVIYSRINGRYSVTANKMQQVEDVFGSRLLYRLWHEDQVIEDFLGYVISGHESDLELIVNELMVKHCVTCVLYLGSPFTNVG